MWRAFCKKSIGWGISIQQTYHFYNLSAEERSDQYFVYYSMLRDKMPQYESQNNLKIDDIQFAKIINYHSGCIEKTGGCGYHYTQKETR